MSAAKNWVPGGDLDRQTDWVGDAAQVHGDGLTFEATQARAREDRAATRARILRALQQRGAYGATDEELQIELQLDAYTERGRRGELVKSGLVCDASFQRATSKQHFATVWLARKELQ